MVQVSCFLLFPMVVTMVLGAPVSGPADSVKTSPDTFAPNDSPTFLPTGPKVQHAPGTDFDPLFFPGGAQQAPGIDFKPLFHAGMPENAAASGTPPCASSPQPPKQQKF